MSEHRRADEAVGEAVGEAVAEVEAHLREQVAACTVMLNHEGILGYSGHVSARLPGERFLVQSFDQSRAELRPSQL
ncbi:MAG: hypothetical protein B7Z75_11980 [Acidocella sp. 20-57-95]|nr:MAG: hypothetical protein B7Z75_11980 [Acidocella sp. 20-57-95]